MDVVDLGELNTPFGRKHKLSIVWELKEKDEQGSHYIVGKRYTWSLNEKSNLRKDLERWRGAKFARYFGQSPDRLSDEHIREYQRYLVEDKKCSWSRLNQTVCALRFFYRVCLDKPQLVIHIPYAKHPKKLPVVLSHQEIARLFEATDNVKHRTLLMTLYATGLRVSEALALQVGDIDSQRMMIRVRQGKAGRDRYVPICPSLLEQLRAYWRYARPLSDTVGQQSPCKVCSNPGTDWSLTRFAGQSEPFSMPNV